MWKLIILSLIALVFIFITCKDQSFLSTPESSPELAAIEGIMVFTWKTGDNPEKTVVLKPQRWDGHSPLKPMVYYHFSSADEIREAFADRTVVLETLNDLLNGNRSTKKKSVQSPALAAARYKVDGWIEHVDGSPGNLKPQGWWVWDSTSTQKTKKGEFWVWDIEPDPKVELDYQYIEGTVVYDSAYAYFCSGPGCGEGEKELRIEVKVSEQGIQKDFDSCNGWCDWQDYIECD